MDHPPAHPARQLHTNESDSTKPGTTPSTPNPSKSNIESILPTANANQLLNLIDQGNDPTNLNQLISHSKQLRDAA